MATKNIISLDRYAEILGIKIFRSPYRKITLEEILAKKKTKKKNG